MQTSELLEIDNTTGEILLPNVDTDSVQQIKQTKIKAVQLLTPNDFVNINGTWEAKRDGLIKILSSLPISYAWEIKEKTLTESYASITGVLTITTADVTRVCDSVGTCELDELRGNKTRHIMIATSETRALKRAIELLFGSVINWYVVNCLVNTRR
jgi:hypothetical protein